MKTKLITISLVSLIVVLAIVPFSSVKAYFSDSERASFTFSTGSFSGGDSSGSYFSSSNISAGVIDIAVNGQNPWFETYEITNMAPGIWLEEDINITNLGNNSTYKISAEWDSTSSQYLFDALQVEIFDARGNLITSVGQFLKDLDTPSRFLVARGEELLKFKVKLGDDAGTEYQNLITKFNLIIVATQIIDRNALIVEFEEAPLFSEANFSPGQSVTRWIKVTNNSGRTQRIATESINVEDPDQLGSVLNLEIKEGGVTKYNNTLSKFFTAGGVYLSDLTSGNSALYNFSISFYPEVSNVFQGKSLSFDILVGFQVTSSGGTGGYFSDAEVSFGNVFTAGTWEVPRIFPDKAAELAKEVIEALYLWGGKGYDFGEIKFADSSNIKESGYHYWNPTEQKIDFGKGLDCAGVSFWGYNRAYYGNQTVSWGRCIIEKDCPIAYEGAPGQYEHNSSPIEKEELKPGDLLFFDTDKNGWIDHVIMFIGEGEVVHAEGVLFKRIIKENLETVLFRYKDYFKGYGRVIYPKIKLRITAYSPVDLLVTDPEGFIASSENPWEGPMEYKVYDINEDGELDKILITGERKIGDYLITVVPELDALPTDTYTLEIEALINGETITTVLAENVPISEIPKAPYILSSTETEIIPIIPAFVDFDPDTLNLNSKGEFVTTYIELPEGYEVSQIDIPSIMLNDLVPALSKPSEIGDYDNDGIPDLMVKFDRSSVQTILNSGEEVTLTFTGKVFHNGIYIDFRGSDVIRVINSNKGKGKG